MGRLIEWDSIAERVIVEIDRHGNMKDTKVSDPIDRYELIVRELGDEDDDFDEDDDEKAYRWVVSSLGPPDDDAEEDEDEEDDEFEPVELARGFASTMAKAKKKCVASAERCAMMLLSGAKRRARAGE